jgi:hypothetical protein
MRPEEDYIGLVDSPSQPADMTAPDNSERIEDFLRRHGGPATRQGNEGSIVPGVSGWSEVYAADGHTLRCEWSRAGTLHEFKFTERPPS